MWGITDTGLLLAVAVFFAGLMAWTIAAAWCFVWVFRMLFVKQWKLEPEEEEERKRKDRIGT